MRKLLFLFLIFILNISILSAATFTVTNTFDSGNGSLRQAITDANNTAGFDVIVFALTGTGPYEINPLTPLPNVIDPLHINGYSQVGAILGTSIAAPVLQIGITGAGFSNCPNTILTIQVNGCVIEGLAFYNHSACGNTAMQINSSNNIIKGCYWGLHVNGITGSDVNNTLRISGNGNMIGGTNPSEKNFFAAAGTRLSIYGSNNKVWGNNFGTRADGSGQINCYFNSILVNSGTGNEIGGINPGKENIIIGSGSAGANPAIKIDGANTTCLIRRNLIYCNASGSIILTNSGNQNYPAPLITAANSLLITGTANPGDSIDVFKDNNLCTPSAMRVYLGSTLTSSIGTWSLNASLLPGDIVNATATPSTGTTSPQSTSFMVNTITTGSISGPLCSGSYVSVPYTVTGTYTSNTFTAQLSDGTGTFVYPINIGSIVSNTSGSITALIPTGTSGTAFRIRVISSNPSITGTDNGTNLTIYTELSNNSISANQAICWGDTPISIAGSMPSGGSGYYYYTWEESNNGTTWNIVSGAYGINYSPAPLYATTFYRRIINSGSCNDTSNTVTITVNALPTVTANTTASIICAGTNVTLTGGGAYTYQWNNGITNGTAFTPSTTATYTVIGTDTNGCSNTDSTTITVNPLPTVTANSTATAVCSGTSITLTGSGADTYLWNNGVTDGIAFTPSATITYTVTGTDANGCSNTDSTTVIVNPLPAVTANTTATAVCLGTNITLTGSGADSYLWNNNVVNGTAFAPIATTTYIVTGTDLNGCSDTASTTITVNPLPTVTANSTATAVCNGSSITLTGGGADAYQWNNGLANGTAFTPTATATYTVIGTDVNGCSNTDSTTVIVNPLPIVTANSTDTIICEGDQVILTGSGANTYFWDNGVTDGSSFSPTVTTTYLVTGIDGNGCSATDTIIISVNNLPAVTLTGLPTICENDSIVLLTEGSPLGGVYSGTGIINGNEFDPSIGPNTYIITYAYTDTNGCINNASDSILVKPSPGSFLTGSNTPLCEGDTLLLNAATVTGAAYTWYGPDNFFSSLQNPTIPNINMVNSGIYAAIININGCKSNPEVLQVNINARPQAPLLSSNSPVCSDSTLMLSAQTDTAGGTFVWFGPNSFTSVDQNPVVQLVNSLNSGTYFATASFNNCTSSPSSLDATIIDIPANPILSSNGPVCKGYQLLLSASEIPGAIYHWTGPAGFSSDSMKTTVENFNENKTGNYYLNISLDGCPGTGEFSINAALKNDCIIKFYNSITPNNDGVNDTWKIDGIASYPDNHVIIFNRWGDKIWETLNYNNEENLWKGNNKEGNPLPAGTYFYIVKIEGEALKGYIELMK